MRRLPVYLLIDTSGSMSGEPIEAVRNGIQTLVSALRQDPYALETTHLSVITFSSAAKQEVPLTELPQFQPVQISASGATAMGEALSLVAKCAEREVAKSTPEAKGDWKPLVFLLTDGEPTDSLERGLADFKKQRWGLVIACAAGVSANVGLLQQITECVVQLDTTDSAAFKAFFKWVSASVSTSSKSVESGGKEITGLDQLPPPPKEISIVT
jgi:uncharacterized protein YegL